MRQTTNGLDLNKQELRNARIHVLTADPSSPQEGQLYYNSTDKVLKWWTGTTWIVVGRLDQATAPTAPVAFGGQKGTGLGDPTAAQDAATKGYVDAIAAGLAWKESVRVATTANITLSGTQTIDGVAVIAGDRILVKAQTAGADNGIYVVAAGAWSRAADADTAADMEKATVFVEEGGTNSDTGWVLTTNPPLTLGTTALVFAQFSGGTVTAGAGLTQTGSSFDVGAGTGITVAADTVALETPVALANGGTGSGTAAGARTNLGAMGRFAADVGDASATSYAVTHNLGTRDVVATLFRNSTPWDEVIADIEHTDGNTVTVRFAVAPASAAFRLVVVG